jgi:hypothetical protein
MTYDLTYPGQERRAAGVTLVMIVEDGRDGRKGVAREGKDVGGSGF